MLAARPREIGTTWTSLHAFREAKAAEILGIHDNATQASLITVAHTTGGDFKPAPTDRSKNSPTGTPWANPADLPEAHRATADNTPPGSRQ